MDGHDFEKVLRTLDALHEEHLPPEVINAWHEEELRKAGFDGWPPRQEDIPEEVSFRVQQRMNKYLSERASEPLATFLREAHRANAEAGKVLLPEDED